MNRYMPDRTRAWAENLHPDYEGPTQSGRFMCALSWTSPLFGVFLWAVMYADNAKTARELAVNEMYKQRLEHDLHDRVADLIH